MSNSGKNPYAAKSPRPTVVKPEALAVQEVSPVGEPSVPTGSIAELLEWVGEDEERAAAALEAELAGHGRKTLVSKLENILGA